MMITHLSPAKAIRAVLLLSTAATAVVGSSTRNIISKNEEVVVSTSPHEEQEPHRALLGLNEMECNESLESNDGSIVCTFRVLPPAADTSSTNNPKLIHDCLFTSGSNFCITTEIYRATYDQANQQTSTAVNQNQNVPPPLVTTVDAELSSAIVPANISPTPPATVVMPSRTETIQIPTPVNGPNCPSTAPNNGSACSWVKTNQYSAFQCGYLSDDTVPQRPGTFINVCKCDAADRFVCGPAVDQIYNRVDATTNNTPPTLATIDTELNSAVIPPPAAVPVAGNTIVNGDYCPSTVPSTGDTCSWVNNNPPKFSAYQCGYLTAGNGNTSNTFIMVCKCDANDTFVCASAGSDVYFNQSF
eukprot:CAMPEP_0170992736 /NCGR_PEP_ID=MMETSP0736-20130129/9918_1 /TAXON_ID=186038 /ORGANISM="Fragilariopsis kerguelensis, Strain L26-C5" /LENGTH=358 /DNA_ID=CAMNT_0011418245 /DNA_START=108 /DNA_END=1184 /DNA_ORIENTATION=-